MDKILQAFEELEAAASAEARRIDAASGYSFAPLDASDAAVAAHAAAWAVVETIADARAVARGKVFVALNAAMIAGALKP